ncbi:MAG: hypothetical protein PHT12_05405 [Patescibacteria group bacterium]|nr:hypothetical protein [Patescibacteria group bacterium]
MRKIRLVDLRTIIVDYGDTHWRLLVRDQYAHVSRAVCADYLHVEDAGTAEVTFECFAFDDGLDVTPRDVLAAMTENGRMRPNRADAETYLATIADVMAHDDEGMSLRNLLADTTGILALCGKVFDQGEIQSAVAIDQTAVGVREIVRLALDDVAPWKGRCFLRVRRRSTIV